MDTHNRRNVLRPPKSIHAVSGQDNPRATKTPIHDPALDGPNLNKRHLIEQDASHEDHDALDHELDMGRKSEAGIWGHLNYHAP